MQIDTKQVGLVHCAQAVDGAVARIEATLASGGKPPGIATGFVDFDRMTSGLHPGQLVIIAAGPCMGKSTFAMNIVENACLRDGVPTAVFSLELTSVDLMERMLYSQSEVSFLLARHGIISKKQAEPLFRMIEKTKAIPLFIDESPLLTIATFRARARQAVTKHGVKLLIVDYLQLMRGYSKRSQQGRRLEIDEISNGLKATAKELNVPVIALSQLNLAGDEREEPSISQLQGSRSIEFCADVMALLHIPERITGNEEDLGKAVLIVTKNLNGHIGRIDLTFDRQRRRFGIIIE